MIVIMILAAGQGSRMRGGDKLLEEIDGQTSLRRMVKRAVGTGAEVVVVVPALDHPRAKEVANARLVPAPEAHLGMAHSIRAGIASLPSETSAVMILPGDMPEIDTVDMNRLMDAFQDSDALILQASTPEGAPGHPVLFAASLFPEFANLSGDRGASPIVEAHRDRCLLLPLQDNRARLDLDTPEDWAAWHARRQDQ